MEHPYPASGKVSQAVFDTVILPRLGRANRRIVVGPQHGVDFGVVDLGGGQVMVTTTDPLYVLPELGWERAAWFAIQIVASDAATSGLFPNYMCIDLNLPMSLGRDDFAAMWESMHRACDDLRLAILTGHTGHYDSCRFPMVGGATVICIGPEARYVTPAMARPGDRIIITKGAAIETAGTLAAVFREKVTEAYGEPFAKQAEDLFWQMTVVKDALTAVEAGVRDDGVTAMHDATEGGVWGGLVEVARASHVGLAIDKGAILLPDTVRKTCKLFDIDPYPASSEGSLIIACKPLKADEVIQRLGDEGIAATIVGEVVPQREGLTYVDDGVARELTYTGNDPFWPAFQRLAGLPQ